MRIRWILVTSLIAILLVCGCEAKSSDGSDLNQQIGLITREHTFNYGKWEINALIDDLRQTSEPGQEDISSTQSVIEYFSYVAQLDILRSEILMLQAQNTERNTGSIYDRMSEINARIEALKPAVERTLALQVSQTLAEVGIYNPFGNSWFKLEFPPVNFSLQAPLYELIISPRDKIQRIKSITIRPEITIAQIQEMESSIDQLNLSSLVVQIGGLGATYPTFVVNNSNLRWTIDTVAHEWLHQYLAFTRLGFSYILDLLGISQNYEICIINETVASMFGQELGAMVYDKYYSQYQNTVETSGGASSELAGFDFNAAMRDIRRNVDSYLAQGQIIEAENYMAEQQQLLASNGYYIRRLNQAYFAFYGSYADSPASIDPIGPKLQSIRDNSPSLKDFLDTVSKFGSGEDLSKAINESQ